MKTSSMIKCLTDTFSMLESFANEKTFNNPNSRKGKKKTRFSQKNAQ